MILDITIQENDMHFKCHSAGAAILSYALAGAAMPAAAQTASPPAAAQDGGSNTVSGAIGGFFGKLKSDLGALAQSAKDNAARGTAAAPIKGLRFSATALPGLFAPYPINGDKPAPAFNGERWYPRVALIPVTVPSEHQLMWGQVASKSTTINGQTVNTFDIGSNGTGVRPSLDRMCWTFRARIWTSPSKSADVPEFLFCASDAAPGVQVGGTPPDTILTHFWKSATQSGSQFTTGPKQPRQFASRKFLRPEDTVAQTYGTEVMLAILVQMGLDPFDQSEGNRAWVADNAFITKDF